MAATASQYLRNHGFAVDHAATGRAALELAAINEYDAWSSTSGCPIWTASTFAGGSAVRMPRCAS